MENYYIGQKDRPYHLSVGAVVLNEENKVCCHYFKKISLRHVMKELTDFYILMSETMEKGESIEETLHRGIMEEFGITGDIVTFLGTILKAYPKDGVSIEKTTLYFLVKMKTFDPKLRSKEDPESGSEIQWQTFDFLKSKMTEQAQRIDKSLDESVILERAEGYIKSKLNS